MDEDRSQSNWVTFQHVFDCVGTPNSTRRVQSVEGLFLNRGLIAESIVVINRAVLLEGRAEASTTHAFAKGSTTSLWKCRLTRSGGTNVARADRKGRFRRSL